jgi:adenylate kinase family enzyme
MKKIIVIGSSGAGKTYFSQRLGEHLGIDVIHIDRVYWRPNWVEPSKEEWKATLGDVLGGESWIIDGNYGATIEMRLAACDTAIFLDIRRTLCMWRVIRRTFKFYKRTRPDMADGCRERLDFSFLSFVWNYPERSRPRIARLLNDAAHEKNVVWLKSPRQVRKYMNSWN